jgi:hypothetical protein
VSTVFNIYCDESCHLEHDHQPVMVLGAVWCPLEKTREIASRIGEIKRRHGLPVTFEIKWSKVSPAKETFYLELLDYFFDDATLHFRVLIVPDKTKLQHPAFGQTHDTWYYKMYFELLNPLFTRESKYRIYLDLKDTRSALKVRKLHEVLCHDLKDFDCRIIEWLQTVHSHEVEQIQLADLLIGAVSYANRGLATNNAKVALVERMKQRSGYSLKWTTALREAKVNIFRWEAQEPQA